METLPDWIINYPREAQVKYHEINIEHKNAVHAAYEQFHKDLMKWHERWDQEEKDE